MIRNQHRFISSSAIMTAKRYRDMNIQIFGKAKCFDTKKAERYFKERRIKFQSIDLLSKGMSKGEFNSVSAAVGGYEKLIDTSSKAYKDSTSGRVENVGISEGYTSQKPHNKAV